MGKFDQAFSPGDVMRRLHDLEQQIRELTAGRRLEDASVGTGGIRVHAGGGIQVEDGGDVEIEGGGNLRITGAGDVQVDDGGDVRVIGGGAVEIFGGTLRVVDSAGTMMLEVGGGVLGISRPWIPLRTQQNVDPGVFWQDVTSATFVNAADACGFLQHGHVIMVVNHQVDSGTTAEFRFVLSDKQGDIATTGVVTVVGDGTHLVFGRTIVVDPTFEVEAPESGHCITLEGRRISGTGTVRTNLGMAYGAGLDGNPYPILG